MITIFLHIRRCGGTTLRHLMHKQFRGRTARCGPEYWSRLQDAPAKQDPDGTALAWYGHMPYGLHEHLEGKCQYITILRHPMDRLVSMWRRRKRPEATLIDVVYGRVNNGPPQTDTIAMPIRILAGLAQDAPIDEAALELAKEHLATFAAVGFSCDYQAFGRVLRDKLGWDTVVPQQIPRLNIGREDHDPKAGYNMAARCPEMVLEQQLYDWAWEQFWVPAQGG